MSDTSTIEQLIENLNHPDWQQRYNAADRLKVFADERAVPALINTLKQDKNPTVRFIAARTLGIIRSEDAVQALANTLSGSDDHDLQWAVAQSLAEIGEPATKPLIQVLGGDDPVARDVAADILANIGDKRAVDPIATAFNRYAKADFEVTKRFGTALALEKFGNAAALGFLTALDHNESVIRARAAAGLGKIRSEEGVPALVDLLNDTAPYDKDNRVCDIAAAALEKIGSVEAKTALEQWQAHS